MVTPVQSQCITILINGLHTESPNGGGAWHKRHPGKVDARERSAFETLAALRRAGLSLCKLWAAGQHKGQAFAVDACRRRYPVTRVVLTRIAPSDGLDRDNLGFALKPVQDGVARALGIDDRDASEERRPGPASWAREQERGPWGVRITIET